MSDNKMERFMQCFDKAPWSLKLFVIIMFWGIGLSVMFLIYLYFSPSNALSQLRGLDQAVEPMEKFFHFLAGWQKLKLCRKLLPWIGFGTFLKIILTNGILVHGNNGCRITICLFAVIYLVALGFPIMSMSMNPDNVGVLVFFGIFVVLFVVNVILLFLPTTDRYMQSRRKL